MVHDVVKNDITAPEINEHLTSLQHHMQLNEIFFANK